MLSSHITLDSDVGNQPLAFVLLASFGAVIDWVAARKFLEERISVMQVRLTDYQECLGLAPKDQTTYSKMTNRELRKATMDLVPKLREFQQTHDQQVHTTLLAERQRIYSLPESERDQALQLNTLTLISQSKLRQMEFRGTYRATAVALADELRRRLPEQKREHLPALDYGMLAGPSPVNEVADYLERLARLLP